MISREDYNYRPTVDEISDYIKNPLWNKFSIYLMEKYNIKPILEFSKCKLEFGWNVKFKKSGKSLCTLYPREGYFTVLLVIGKKEKNIIEEVFSSLSLQVQKIYMDTKEGMGQRWLMIDLEDEDNIYEDVKKIIEIRHQTR